MADLAKNNEFGAAMRHVGDSHCGLLNLNKPSGMTSRAVVDCVSRPLRGTKVGHAGTLDPLASGVLVVCVGAATRLIALVQEMPKTYRTVIRLDATSDTLDADGQIMELASPRTPGESQVREVLASQVGTILQRPPEYSAVKVAGRRAYDLARAGQAVELEPRPVRIDRIELLRFEWPRLELEIDCGGGTYIRSIARDVGEALGCGGLVEVLVRTRIGPFRLEEAIDPLPLSRETIPSLLRPAAEAAAFLPKLPISAASAADVSHGRWVERPTSRSDLAPGVDVALIGPDGALVAIGEVAPDGGRIIPRRVLSSQATGGASPAIAKSTGCDPELFEAETCPD